MQLLLICRLSHSPCFLAKGLALRVAVAACLSLVFLATPATAFELGAGYGAVEQGDDRLEPTATVHLGIGDYLANAYYYGRTYGPVREDNYILAVARRWDLFKTNALSVNLGLSLIDERVAIAYSQPAFAAAKSAKDVFNLGADFGVAWSFLPALAPLWGQIAWDSHIFPAGVNGGLFLSSGRKQVISLSFGVELK